MPVKIRLQRMGKKANPFYHIVVADVRAPRDGKFIESIGAYNPKTNPATIEINSEKALDWIEKGAQPTDTTRAILSYKGVLYRYHLNRGIKKGALTQEVADEKFNAWMEQKNLKISQKVQSLQVSQKDSLKSPMDEEEKVRQKNAEKLAAKRIAASEAAAAAAVAAVTPAPEEGVTSPEEGATPAPENTEGA